MTMTGNRDMGERQMHPHTGSFSEKEKNLYPIDNALPAPDKL